jgi:hypothetical protein
MTRSAKYHFLKAQEFQRLALQEKDPQQRLRLLQLFKGRRTLARAFQRLEEKRKAHLREQSAYRHMIHLADVFDGWALDSRNTPEQSIMILGWADSLRELADEVGPDWDPPESGRLSLMGFLGRKAVGE